MSNDAPDALPPLNGADYRAKYRLSNGADETLAEIGDTCERIPAQSLPWLLADGMIEPATPPDQIPHRRAHERILGAIAEGSAPPPPDEVR